MPNIGRNEGPEGQQPIPGSRAPKTVVDGASAGLEKAAPNEAQGPKATDLQAFEIPIEMPAIPLEAFNKVGRKYLDKEVGPDVTPAAAQAFADEVMDHLHGRLAALNDLSFKLGGLKGKAVDMLHDTHQAVSNDFMELFNAKRAVPVVPAQEGALQNEPARPEPEATRIASLEKGLRDLMEAFDSRMEDEENASWNPSYAAAAALLEPGRNEAPGVGAPDRLQAAIEQIANLKKDGEMLDDGTEFDMTNDDACDTVASVIDLARNALAAHRAAQQGVEQGRGPETGETSLDAMMADATQAREAYWAKLEAVEKALAPRLAGFFKEIGLVQAVPYVDTETYDNSVAALELVWDRPDVQKPAKGKENTIRGVDVVCVTERDILQALIEHPEECFDSNPLKCPEDLEAFVEEVRAAAKAHGINIEQVSAHLDDQSETIGYEHGIVSITEVVLPD